MFFYPGFLEALESTD